MRKTLTSIVLLPLIMCTYSCKNLVKTDSDITYVKADTRLASLLYFGRDNDMPTNDTFLFSINYSPNLPSPPISSIESLSKVFQKSLPHWYLAAMIRNYKENRDCTVLVNKEEYTKFVDYWMREYLLRRDLQPIFADYINRLGYKDVTQQYRFPGLEYSAYVGTCALIATNDHELAEQEMIKELNAWRAFFNELSEDM